MRAVDFLAGPRGRAVCVAYVGMWPDRWQPVPDLARSPMGSLADATTRAMYWQDPEDFELDALPTDAANVVRRAARDLAAHPDTSWWDSPAAPSDQHVVEFELGGELSSEPRLSGLRAGIDALAGHHDAAGGIPGDVDWRIVSGIWWSAPIAAHGLRSTRSAGSPTQPVGLACVEDPSGWRRAHSWRIEPVDRPRLFEITGPADWLQLCRDYPLDVTSAKRGDWWRATGRDGPWVMPDWPAVAREWDAVHLTVCGYLTTAGCALDVDGEHASVLAGWDPDATFWLNDVLRRAGPTTRWACGPDGDWRRDS